MGVVVMLALAAFAALPAAGDGKPSTARDTTRAEWVVLHVGANQRAIRLVYLAGGCLLPDGRASVVETRTAIDIRVEQTSLGLVDCTYDLLLPRLTVHLKRPIGGRRIRGQTFSNEFVGWFWRTRERAGTGFPLVPGVVGLSAREAARVLRRQRFKVRTVHRPRRSGRPRVVSQTPRVGQLSTKPVRSGVTIRVH